MNPSNVNYPTLWGSSESSSSSHGSNKIENDKFLTNVSTASSVNLMLTETNSESLALLRLCVPLLSSNFFVSAEDADQLLTALRFASSSAASSTLALTKGTADANMVGHPLNLTALSVPIQNRSTIEAEEERFERQLTAAQTQIQRLKQQLETAQIQTRKAKEETLQCRTTLNQRYLEYRRGRLEFERKIERLSLLLRKSEKEMNLLKHQSRK